MTGLARVTFILVVHRHTASVSLLPGLLIKCPFGCDGAPGPEL